MSTDLSLEAYLRSGEAALLRVDSVQFYGDTVVIAVRPRRGQRLKTLSSTRMVVIREDEDVAKRFRSHVASVLAQRGRRRGLLCIEDLSYSESRHLVSTGFSYIAHVILPKQMGRYQVGRHDFARHALIICLPDAWSAPLTPLDAHCARRDPVNPRITRRSALLYRARQLGHGTSDTLICVYSNLLSILGNSAVGLPNLLQRDIAAILMRSHESVRQDMIRLAKKSSNIWQRGLRAAQVPDCEVVQLPPPPVQPPSWEKAFGRTVEILIRIRAGRPPIDISRECNASVELVMAIQTHAEVQSQILGIPLLASGLGERLSPHENAKAVLKEIARDWPAHRNPSEVQTLARAILDGTEPSLGLRLPSQAYQLKKVERDFAALAICVAAFAVIAYG